MDLAGWYTQRRWVGLLELIDQLPANSRLREAALDDPEQAALLADLPQPDEPWRPRLSEWDLTAQVLTQIYGVLGAIFQQTVANGGHKPKPVPDLPVPETEVDRIREQRITQKLTELERILMGR